MALPAKSRNCPQCPYKTTLKFKMENHMMTHNFPKLLKFFNCSNPIEPLKCYQCDNFETQNLAHLQCHFKAGHTLPDFEEKFYDCENCNLRTNSQYLFVRHKLFRLCIKVEEFKSESKATEETTTVEFRQNQWFQCEECSYETKTKLGLTRHMYTHKKREKKYDQLLKCEHCNCSYETSNKYLLRKHILSKHTDPEKIQWFECAHCSHKTKTKSGLNNHLIFTHYKPQSLKCNRCPFKTKFRHELKRHILVKHEREKIQWFQCPQCPYKGQTKYALKSHTKRKHDKDKFFNCNHCNFQTKTKCSLQNHILLQHTDPNKVKWFCCKICSYKSPLECRLRNHISRLHAKNYCEVNTRPVPPLIYFAKSDLPLAKI